VVKKSIALFLHRIQGRGRPQRARGNRVGVVEGLHGMGCVVAQDQRAAEGGALALRIGRVQALWVCEWASIVLVDGVMKGFTSITPRISCIKLEKKYYRLYWGQR
jgi:hypothetical protein